MFNKHFIVTIAHFVGTALVLKLLNFILPSFLTNYYFSVANALLYSILSWHTFSLTKKYVLSDKIRPERKAVLITGCDSGFGHNLAKRLDLLGFDVFATCMFPSGEGAEELRKNCTKRLKILDLDVTKEESIEKAVEFLKANLGSSVLWAIVNNAGVAHGLAAEVSGIPQYKDSMEVNVFGVIRITKAFLPFLKKSKGRVVNVTSIFGRVTVPCFSPYCVSKYAAVGFSDSLRQDLVDWGIRVISVEPELFQTGMTRLDLLGKHVENTFSKLSEAERVDYDEEFERNVLQSLNKLISLSSPKIQLVVDDLVSAITLEYPNNVYSPRRNAFARLLCYICIMAPTSINEFMSTFLKIYCRWKKPKNAYN